MRPALTSARAWCTARPIPAECGVITSVGERYVFVRYRSEHAVVKTGSQATSPEDLELLTPLQAQRREFRASLRTGGDDE